MKKYYLAQHENGYKQMLEKGFKSWHDLHQNSNDYDAFPSRSFLRRILPRLKFVTSNPCALELGCGTGSGSCFLARKGFKVWGIDIIPLAIYTARNIANEFNLEIQYEVMDVCDLPHNGEKFDLIFDSFCLQGIVTDNDRSKLFSAVHARLKLEGYYIISTSMYWRPRHNPNEEIIDLKTGKTYTRYDEDCIFDDETEIKYDPFYSLYPNEMHENYDQTIIVNNIWYIANRRYRTAKTFRTELEKHGFKVLLQCGEEMEYTICVLKNSTSKLKLI